jgi:hypothetical protein
MHIYNGGICYSATRKNEIMSFAGKLMGLDIIMFGEMSQA